MIYAEFRKEIQREDSSEPDPWWGGKVPCPQTGPHVSQCPFSPLPLSTEPQFGSGQKMCLCKTFNSQVTLVMVESHDSLVASKMQSAVCRMRPPE